MSRIGKKPISVPEGVEITIEEENKVTVTGPKGKWLKDSLLPEIKKEEWKPSVALQIEKSIVHFTVWGEHYWQIW